MFFTSVLLLKIKAFAVARKLKIVAMATSPFCKHELTGLVQMTVNAV